MPKIPKTGAEALIRCLEKEGVEYIFGYPGGSVIPIFDVLYDSTIKLVLTRHEQGASHMADGYARACGKPGVVLVTSGPGATNTITGVFNAHMDSVPMIVLTGQTTQSGLGKDAFQEADIFDISMPVVKHSYLVRDPNDFPRIVREAFHIALTGRPGPVLIDIPKDVASGDFTGTMNAEMDIPGYKIPNELDNDEILKIAGHLNRSQRPLLLVGHGAIIARATVEIKSLAEKLQAPVANTMLGKGGFPETHPLSLGMIGMHGTAYANIALTKCDLIMSFGSRWDDRINGDNARFAPGAIKIHIDIDPAEIGKIVKPDAMIIGDCRQAADELLKHINTLNTRTWLRELNIIRKKNPLRYKKQGGLKVQHIVDELYDLTKGQAVICTDVGQHQMWTSQYYLIDEPDTWISSGGAGTMGFGFPAAIGAKIARPTKTVCVISGDGGFQMTMMELATAKNLNLPLKIIIMDNKYLGMVRQWQDLFFDNRLSGVTLDGNPDFIKLAESYGIKGFRLKRSADVKKILSLALAYNDGPCVIHADVVREENVYPMIPAGKSAEHLMTERPKRKLEKPTGST